MFRYTEDARATLRVVVPITLAIMFILLVAAFRSVSDSVLIMLSAPFALVGGVLLQWYLGYSMTTAVIIGYVSLFAVAIQTGIIMIEFIREALARRPATQPYMDAVVEGSVARLRPKLMTVATTVLGLLPIMFATGSGMDITKPIATPTFGGMITLDDLRAVPDPMPVCHRCRRPQSLACNASRARSVPAALMFVLAIALVGCGSPEGSPASVVTAQVLPAAGSSDGLVVRFGTEPNPPAKGDNSVQVTVTKPDGSPLTTGTVTAVFSMPAMPSMNMPAMRSDTALEHEGEGRYRGTGQLSMGGTWNVAITIADGSKEVATRQTSIVVKE